MTDSTSPKPFVFVLMPFAEEFNDIYKLGIKGACQDAGAYCERVDEQIFTESILERVYNQIAKCDLIVSDMSGRNPNVFYETGYAHALGKKVVLLTQNIDDVPFDMKHYPHIIYKKDSIAALKDELKRRVDWIIANPEKNLQQSEFSLEYYFYGTLITDGTSIKINPSSLSNFKTTITNFSISIHNPTGQTLNLQSCSLGLQGPWISGGSIDIINNRLEVMKSSIHRLNKENVVPITGQETIAFFTLPNYLFPDGWTTVSCIFGIYDQSEKEFPCSIKLYREIGVKDINFKIKLGDSVELDPSNQKQ